MANGKQQTKKLSSPGQPIPPGASRSIYFSDGEKLNQLNKLLAKYPRTTLSSVLNQFIGPTVEGIRKAPADTREVEITARIWL